MLSNFLEAITENDYVFLSFACCVVVVVPILALYALSWSQSLMAALN